MSGHAARVFGVLTLCLACERGALQPADGHLGGIGGAAAAGGAPGGSGAASTSTPGATLNACARIATDAGRFNPCGRAYGIAYSPDGQLLAIGTEGRRPNVHVWRLSDGLHVRAIDGVGRVTYQVAFSPDGRTLATAGADDDGPPFEIVKLWDVASGALLRTIPANCGSYAATAAFSHDGALIATAGYTGAVEIWRVAQEEDEEAAPVLGLPYPTTVQSVQFSPDDSQLLVSGVDRRATLWNLRDATLALALPGTGANMADAAFSPDGRVIATTGAGNGLLLWDAASGALLQTINGHDAYVSHLLWIDVDHLVYNDWNGWIRSWRRNNGIFAPSSEWSTGGQSLGLALSPDGATLAAGGAEPAPRADGFVFLAP